MLTAGKIRRFFAELTFPRSCYIVVAATLLSCALGIAVGDRFVMPVLNLAAVAPFYIWAAVRGRYGAAVGIALLWLVCIAAFITVGTMLFPARTGGAVFYGPAFNEGFNGWLAGSGFAWGKTAGYVRAVASQGSLTGGLSIFTGGLGGLLVAAVNVNYVSYNAGKLLLSSSNGTLSLAFAWPFWEVLKAIGLVNLSVGFGVSAFRFILRRKVSYKTALEYILIGLLFVGLGIFVHWQAASFWRDVLADITLIG